MLEKEAKKNEKKCLPEPNKKTCLSKEREARRRIRVDQACNPKAEDLKVGWAAENSPNQHKTTNNIKKQSKTAKTQQKTIQKQQTTLKTPKISKNITR